MCGGTLYTKNSNNNNTQGPAALLHCTALPAVRYDPPREAEPGHSFVQCSACLAMADAIRPPWHIPPLRPGTLATVGHRCGVPLRTRTLLPQMSASGVSETTRQCPPPSVSRRHVWPLWLSVWLSWLSCLSVWSTTRSKANDDALASHSPPPRRPSLQARLGTSRLAEPAPFPDRMPPCEMCPP
jgi:hypothetical protein